MKKGHTQDVFSNTEDKWRLVKDINGTNKTFPPNNITINNKSITTPKELAKISNN